MIDDNCVSEKSLERLSLFDRFLRKFFPNNPMLGFIITLVAVVIIVNIFNMNKNNLIKMKRKLSFRKHKY